MWKHSQYHQIKIMAGILADLNINFNETIRLIAEEAEVVLNKLDFKQCT
jgi:hypothetical protein